MKALFQLSSFLSMMMTMTFLSLLFVITTTTATTTTTTTTATRTRKNRNNNGDVGAIRDYHPTNDVSFLSALGSDLHAIDILLQSNSDQGFDLAKTIYENGAFSSPYATLTIRNNDNDNNNNQGTIPFDLPEGTKLYGTSMNGQSISVTIKQGFSYKRGDVGPIHIVHDQLKQPSCHRARIPDTTVAGCLIEQGTLSLDENQNNNNDNNNENNDNNVIIYSYSTHKDIQSDHTIQNLSVYAASKYKPHGNAHAPYYKDFQKFVDFFDNQPQFADSIVSAAFGRSIYQVDKYGLYLNFINMTYNARRLIILHTCSYMIITLFVIRQLETALVHCDHWCHHNDNNNNGNHNNEQPSNCNNDSIHALDGAVALYTGDLYYATQKGNFMYGLAQHMCQQFKTCIGNNNNHNNNKDGLSIHGEAKVNSDVFNLFNQMKINLQSSNCLQAKINKETIAHEIFVPLVQATYLSLYMDPIQNNNESRAERVVFLTSILPLLHHCDTTAAVNLLFNNSNRLNPLQNADNDTLYIVKQNMELNYNCMGLGCLNVGGLWDEQNNTYVPGVESCYVPPPPTNHDNIFHMIWNHYHFIIILFIIMSLIVGIIYHKRRQRKLLQLKKQQRRQERRRRRRRNGYNDDDDDDDDSDDDDDDSDDDSFDDEHSIHELNSLN